MAAAVRILRADLDQAPFAAPDAERLRKLGLDGRAVAAAERAGLLMRVSDHIVLAPGAADAAVCVLAGLPQPFTAAEARLALGTTRRTAIPLLEYLDRAGVTERLPDDRRQVRAGAVSAAQGRRARRLARRGSARWGARRVAQRRAGNRLADQVPGSAGCSPAEIHRASTAAVAGAFRMPVRK